jgi:carboxyl-terminal processing protease
MKTKFILSFILLIPFQSSIAQIDSIHKSNRKCFEEFWTTFKEHYAFFELKQINWDRINTKYHPLIDTVSSDESLVTIFSQMVAPLQDGHITISKGEEVLYKCKKKSQFKQEFKGKENEFWNNTNKVLQHNSFDSMQSIGAEFRGEKLFYVAQSPTQTYLRISRCFHDVESVYYDSLEVEDTKVMLHLLDSILTYKVRTKCLIIDLRSNGGGHAGIEMASRFASQKVISHYKSTKIPGGYTTFTTPESQYITPYEGHKFLGHVILLVNDRTASSAEDFVISLCHQSNVLVIGNHTAGMLSDMYNAELPNGMSFTLSNQVYYDLKMKIVEDKGIQPDYLILNQFKDLKKQKDPVLQKAISIAKSFND